MMHYQYSCARETKVKPQKKLQETTYGMNTHHIKREHSNVARGREGTIVPPLACQPN